MKAREQFTAGQRKQLSAEIRKQVAIENERYERDYDTLILFVLHTVFGFGRERLLRFFIEMATVLQIRQRENRPDHRHFRNAQTARRMQLRPRYDSECCICRN